MCLGVLLVFFFFKQKTAYEMRISDWSSDVCSSDLRVTDLYLRRGYYLAQAVLPVQEVVDGVVEISVVEGRLGQVTVQVDPKAPIDEARVRAMLAPLQPGQPLHRERYERAMLLLSDLPGLRVQSAIEPGLEPGTTDLTVQIAPGDRSEAHTSELQSLMRISYA